MRLPVLLFFLSILLSGIASAFSPYDTHGQLTGAERRLMAGTSPAESDAAIPGQHFDYGYNAGGNRTAATQGGGGVDEDVTAGYTPTAANQYASLSHNRTALTTGAAEANATVEVNEAAAARAGPWWGYSELVPGINAATVDFATTANYNGHFDQILARPLVPPATVTPIYDGDGNLIDDGLRTFIWDAENRLAFVVTKDSALPPGAPHYRVGFQYDDLGRRIAQTVEARPTPEDDWVVARRRAFLYDGWQCVAEYDYARTSGGGATHILFRSQVWGLDIGGGAGGLLMVRRHTGPLARLHYAVSDGNGNVTALFDTLLLQESARYDYDPFGNLLRATGYAAGENPYRFSSQFTDDVTGLVYYGYRHYDPVHGRWLSRDPIGEAGGVNLYGFVGNDGINGVDLLGLDPWYERGWDGVKEGAGNVWGGMTGSWEGLFATGDWWGEAVAEDSRSSAQRWQSVGSGAEYVSDWWRKAATNGEFQAELSQNWAHAWEELKRDPSLQSKVAAEIAIAAMMGSWGAQARLARLSRIEGAMAELAMRADDLRAVEQLMQRLAANGSAVDTAKVSEFFKRFNCGKEMPPAMKKFVEDLARKYPAAPEIQNSLPRRRLRDAEISPGMEADPSAIEVYRGGRMLDFQPNEVRIVGGKVQPSHGVSLFSNPGGLQKYGGAWLVESVPGDLKVIQRGQNLRHFEIVPRIPMSPERFQELLRKLTLKQNQ